MNSKIQYCEVTRFYTLGKVTSVGGLECNHFLNFDWTSPHTSLFRSIWINIRPHTSLHISTCLQFLPFILAKILTYQLFRSIKREIHKILQVYDVTCSP